MSDAGGRRDRITILRRSSTRDAAYNSAQVTYVELRKTWGRIEDVVDRNSEETTDRTRKNVRRRKVFVPWQTGITTDMRIKINAGTVEYDIVNLADVGYRDEICLAVEEYRS